MDVIVHDPLVLYNRTKFTDRDIPTLKECIVVDSVAVGVEVFRFEQPNNWHFTEFKSITDTLEIKHVQVSIPLADIYEAIIFD